jgi:hypothetical protein
MAGHPTSSVFRGAPAGRSLPIDALRVHDVSGLQMLLNGAGLRIVKAAHYLLFHLTALSALVGRGVSGPACGFTLSAGRVGHDEWKLSFNRYFGTHAD